jgi:very-short-patch-repair endonuclease
MDERLKEEIATIGFHYEVYLMDEVERCESPIEELLGVWLVHLRDWSKIPMQIEPQCEIETGNGVYRVDFLVTATIKDQRVVVAVECDGHDYHERTKEQASRDKKRDRALKLAGLDVLHFTGSEIWKDPNECAREVLLHISAKTERK